MFQITKEYTFIAAHTIEGHPKCGRMHGHNYQVDVTLEAGDNELDSMGFIIDFADIDIVIKPFLKKLDHYYIKSNSDKLIVELDYVELYIHQSSAELLARWFYDQLYLTFHENIASVTVWETPKARATYYGKR